MALKKAAIARLERKRDPQTGQITSVFLAARTEDDALKTENGSPAGTYFEHWITGEDLQPLLGLTIPGTDQPDYTAQGEAVMAVLVPLAEEKHAAWLAAREKAPVVEAMTPEQVQAMWGASAYEKP